MGKRSEVREETYENLIIDAGAACYYWWFEAPGDGYTLPDWDDITTDDVARGWQKLLKVERDGHFHCCGNDQAVRLAERDLAAGETPDYDACVADAVIQLALLGDIVYG